MQRCLLQLLCSCFYAAKHGFNGLYSTDGAFRIHRRGVCAFSADDYVSVTVHKQIKPCYFTDSTLRLCITVFYKLFQCRNNCLAGLLSVGERGAGYRCCEVVSANILSCCNVFLYFGQGVLGCCNSGFGIGLKGFSLLNSF